MNISNAIYMPVNMRWDTFTFPINAGTPISKEGVLANDAEAFGIVSQAIEKAPLMPSIPVVVGGDVVAPDYEISSTAKAALKNIRFY